jgi:hypothetical protein
MEMAISKECLEEVSSVFTRIISESPLQKVLREQQNARRKMEAEGSLMFCKECGTGLKSEKATFCGKCGAKVVWERDDADGSHGYCPYCGDVLAEGAKHCVKCGEKVEQREEGESTGFCENCGAKLFGCPPPYDGEIPIGINARDIGQPVLSFCHKCGVKVG